jgi:FkbM family methyltransferase
MLINFTNLYKKYNMNIKGIVHIGAHYGEEIQEYVDNGIQNITVFEPLSKNFDVLAKRLQNVNADIQGYQTALGSEKGTAKMYLSSNEAQSSSILKPKDHLEHHPDVTFDGDEEVEVDLLDNFDLRSANFMNVDVQGYELEVFKGAVETLKNIDYVYCEVNRGEMYEGNPLIEDIDEFLGEYGFERVETHWPETWYKWGDALYVKKSKRADLVDTSKNGKQLYWNATYEFTHKFFNEHPELKVGAEIGIAGGQHIKRLLEKTNLEKVYGVDPLTSEMWTISNMDCVNVDSDYGGFDNLYDQIVGMLEPYGDRSEIIRKTSLDAVDNFEDESLDFVFVDAIHTYENCLEDLTAWEPKVKPGGYIMGHDWEHPSYPGVQKAVEEFFEDKEITGVLSPVHVWYVQK